ncbi:dTDP-4-dehydrorhamnose reductase [mine drainage metagenome]|uniref:dTDP-4-dehydrorhamnose reductase n=1 Tax=mine drainage metagenome TaxID=410659 RepID=A0A1J5RH19_9ZZZZ
MRNILLTGATGQVGRELQRTLAPLGNVRALDRRALDLAHMDAIRAAIREQKPDLIVNAAAYTAVDQAAAEPGLAMIINGQAPGVMAEEARKLGALLVHYSTDYVFDGAKADPYTEEDEPAPINAYGSSKLAGERAIQASGCRHLIFRTSWVYGLFGKNFLRTILRLASEREELRIVADQTGAPTWSRMIAEATALALRGDPPSGLYHMTSAGATSWHGFAQAILDAQGWRCKLVPIATHDYPLPATRPANSRLDNGKLAADFDLALPDWRHALGLCLADGRG